jgi:hypothetical protein
MVSMHEKFCLLKNEQKSSIEEYWLVIFLVNFFTFLISHNKISHLPLKPKLWVEFGKIGVALLP